MPASLITLTTDFGLADGYVGTMKGVIFSRAPHTHIIDLSHEIAPQDIAAGAFVLYRAYRYFSPETIHVVVVDPGVGTARRALLLVTDQGRFVGPDNGLFGYALREAIALAAGWVGTPASVPAVWHPDFDVDATLATTPREYLPAAYLLNNASYWLAGPGATFQGRDLFAPVAAHLANGAAPADLGQPVALESLTLLPASASRVSPDVIEGHVISADHFGNLITNIAAGLLPALGPLEALQVTLGPHRLQGIHSTYGVAQHGTPLVLINSAGLLEIAIREGHAARQLGSHVGDRVLCSHEKEPGA
jgi:S-adenosyl-L-methionine hydrolase (adenosine-forming)